MSTIEQQVAQSKEVLETLRREARIQHELAARPRLSLRRRLAHALRAWAANLEPEAVPARA
jgi:hypothetical protein